MMTFPADPKVRRTAALRERWACTTVEPTAEPTAVLKDQPTAALREPRAFKTVEPTAGQMVELKDRPTAALPERRAITTAEPMVVRTAERTAELKRLSSAREAVVAPPRLRVRQ